MITSITSRKDCYQLRKADYQMADVCELCGSVENLVIDHIMPLSQGGSNELDNLRTLCSSCNTKEGWKYRKHSQVIKYTTHLRTDTIRWIKRYALEHDLKDYEVVQMVLDEFIERRKAKQSKAKQSNRTFILIWTFLFRFMSTPRHLDQVEKHTGTK